MTIFDAFYRSTTADMPMTLPQVVAYVWLGQAFRGPIGWSADPDVHQQVHTGTVAYKMLRPVDVPTYWFMRCMPIRFGTLMLRATPILVVSYLVVGITLPPSVGHLALSAFHWLARSSSAAHSLRW